MELKNREKFEASKGVINEALKVLDKKNVALIAHGGSFPSNSDEDTGFGSPNSEGAKRLMNFASGVFNGLQMGPAGKTKEIDASPYTGTIFSTNPLFIDLKQLTTDKWGRILSEQTFEEIVNNNPKKDSHIAAYAYIYKEQKRALKEAFSNFQPDEEYENYKRENAFWLDKDSLYEALIIENGNDYWPNWKNELDKKLFNADDADAANNRIAQIQEKYKNEIEFYKFCQYVVSKQNVDTLKYAKEKGIKMIADRQVAFSDRDSWAYQAYFLDGWCLGCPPDYFSKDGQAWGFPVMNPEKMFNSDGSLGEGGIIMKQLYKKMFRENPGGVRIDHMVGLIDPWVYKKGSKPKVEEGAGRLYSSPQHEFLSRFAIATMEDINTDFEPDEEKWIKKLNEEQIAKYGALVEKIVIAAALEEGQDKDSIVAEDLGTLTFPVEAVMEKYDLQGMKLVQFVVAEEEDHPYRCKNITPRSWNMVGTHDNEPVRMWAKSIVNTQKAVAHAENLAQDLYSYAENLEEIKHRLRTDAEFLTETKLVEIFASKAQNVQIFFTDLFGMEEVYNKPGTCGDKNWALRIPNNFEEFYESQLQNHKALNLPVILSLAIKARGEDFALQHGELLKQLEENY